MCWLSVSRRPITYPVLIHNSESIWSNSVVPYCALRPLRKVENYTDLLNFSNLVNLNSLIIKRIKFIKSLRFSKLGFSEWPQTYIMRVFIFVLIPIMTLVHPINLNSCCIPWISPPDCGIGGAFPVGFTVYFTSASNANYNLGSCSEPDDGLYLVNLHGVNSISPEAHAIIAYSSRFVNGLFKQDRYYWQFGANGQTFCYDDDIEQNQSFPPGSPLGITYNLSYGGGTAAGPFSTKNKS